MAIKSYSDIYLSIVAENIGTMFECAVDNRKDPRIFWNIFVNSKVAQQIENGNPKYLSCSAQDYLIELLKETKLTKKQNINKDRFYWAGWILAQYQQRTGYSFYKINNNLPIEKVLVLYDTLHEADVSKFYDVADKYFVNKGITNLKRARQAAGLSQSKLAKKSEVALRSIQMFEQRRNDINKAQVETVYRLSKTLGCRIEDLLEN